MDIQRIEYAARMFFEMCAQHPEICPHDFHWQYGEMRQDGTRKSDTYVCHLCGQEKIKYYDEEGKEISYLDYLSKQEFDEKDITKAGTELEMFVDGEWKRGVVIEGYRYQDGIVTIQSTDGIKYFCGQDRTDLYRVPQT